MLHLMLHLSRFVSSLSSRPFIGAGLVFAASLPFDAGSRLVWGQPARTAAESNSRPPVAAALRSIFSAAAAPEQKTMGLLQRSFVEVAQRTMLSDLEIAVVIDGTFSMADEIEGIRLSLPEMLEDLRRGRDGELRVGMVVYRDRGSPSGTVVRLVDRFTADDEVLTKALQQIEPEDGAPFFHEMPDAGIHEAITQLPWSEDEHTTRWILLFGDAPPYPENYSSPDVPQAKRAYATDQLVGLATQKDIRIHCLMCTSGEELSEVYEQAAPETRGFMHALASGTGGLFLDLSYADIRKAIIEAGNQPRHDYQAIDPISQDDLMAATRGPGNDAQMDPLKADVRVAVLPHMPVSQLLRLQFNANSPAVQVATALRHKLRILPRIRIVPDSQVERALRRIRADRRYPEDDTLIALASQMRVDYLFWGDAREPGPMIQSAVYSGKREPPIVRVQQTGNVTQLAIQLLKGETNDRRFNSLISQQQGLPDERISKQLQTALARDPVTTRELWVALHSMERLLGYLPEDPESQPLLEQARTSAEAALKIEPTNGLAHWLLSNVHFNLATAAQAAGDEAQARRSMGEMKRALQQAYLHHRQIDSLSLQGEIRADYAFLVERDVPTAINYYEALMSREDVFSADVRRRAHWMLTGIYSGDWGVQPSLVDPVKARKHAIAILSEWEDSSEATLLRKWLGWNPNTRETEHPFLPKSHGVLARYAQEAPQSG